MNPAAMWLLGLASAVILAVAVRAARLGVAGAARSSWCGSPQFRQFDFLAGDWATYAIDAPATPMAQRPLTLTLDGCIAREVCRQNAGTRGASFSMYDMSRDPWHQTWVTNRGKLLQLDGHLFGERVILTGTEMAPDGTSSLLRGVWCPEPGGVRESAERSTDGGKTWTPAFDIVFRPRARS